MHKESEATLEGKMSGMDCTQAVGTLVILCSPLASGMSKRPRQPGSDLTISLHNISIPKAEILKTEERREQETVLSLNIPL